MQMRKMCQAKNYILCIQLPIATYYMSLAKTLYILHANLSEERGQFRIDILAPVQILQHFERDFASGHTNFIVIISLVFVGCSPRRKLCLYFLCGIPIGILLSAEYIHFLLEACFLFIFSVITVYVTGFGVEQYVCLQARPVFHVLCSVMSLRPS